MKVYHVKDSRFSTYGRIIEGYDFSKVIKALEREEYPADVLYMASSEELEAFPVFREFERNFYGQLGAELGFCMGHNDRLNGLEYHRGSEVNISVTPFIVMIGRQQDLEEDFRYNTEKVEAFYVPAGLAVEFYATTLHYCACHVNKEGYAHATFLPKGTNTPLDPDFVPKTKEDTLLQAKNKWLIAHPEGGQASTVPVTMYGPNWSSADFFLEDLEEL